MFFFWFQTKDLDNYKDLRPAISLRDPRMVRLFVNSFLFQLVNPVLLPSPVLARQIHVILFRWSNNGIFLISSLMGWMMGQLIFTSLSRLFIARIERDSPMVHLFFKRGIHATFSIITLFHVICCLGRAPIPFCTKKYNNDFLEKDLEFQNIKNTDIIWWIFKPWPVSFFDLERSNQPTRFKRISRINGNSFVKTKVSNYFFGKCLTDGKQRLCFAALPGLSILDNEIEESLEKEKYGVSIARSSPYQDWIFDELAKAESLTKELKDRIDLLDAGSTFWNAMEKETNLAIAESSTRLPKVYDPFLAKFSGIKIQIPETSFAADELNPATEEKTEFLDEIESIVTIESSVDTDERIEDWISGNNTQSKHMKTAPLPWDELPKRTQRLFHFMANDRFLSQSNIPDIVNEIENSYRVDIIWEDIFDLDPLERTLFFTYLQEDYCSFNKLNLYNILSVNGEKLSQDPRYQVCSIHEVEDLEKVLVHYTQTIFESKYELPGIDSDIRYRKLKNLGITFGNTKRKTTKIVKRFERVPDFRRRIVKGSLRSKRRKIPLWRFLEDKVHSPFFLRFLEVPNLIKISGLKLFFRPNYEKTFIKLERRTLESKKSRLVSKTKKLMEFQNNSPSMIAARMDIAPIHSGRGLLLVFQAILRKYFTMPLAIICKNIVRSLLRQDSEWDIDWMEWSRETYINCTYDGEEYSQIRFPGRWLKEGLQIKILYPFELKPWHTYDKKKQSIVREGENLKPSQNPLSKKADGFIQVQGRPPFSYLTAWGFQVEVPFGKLKKQSSFWKPIRKKLFRIFQKNFMWRVRQFFRLYTKLNLSVIPKSGEIFDSMREIGIVSNNSSFKRIKTFDKENLNFNSDRETFQIEFENSIESKWNFGESGSTFFLLPSQFGREFLGFKEIHLQLRLSLTKVTEHFFEISSKVCRITQRALVHYLTQLFVLQRQLIRTAKSNVVNNFRGEYSGVFLHETKGLVSRTNRFQSISQAYIYDKLWSTSIDGISYLNLLLTKNPESDVHTAKTKNNRDQGQKTETFQSIQPSDYNEYVDINPTNQSFLSCFMNENIIKYGEGWGFPKQLSALDLNNWNNWIDSFSRYNLPLEVWDSVASQKWKLHLFNSDEFYSTETEVPKKKNTSSEQEEIQSYSIYVKNPLLKDRINNYNKRVKYSYLLNSFTDYLRDGHTHQFSTQQDLLILKRTFESKKLTDRFYNLFNENEIDFFGGIYLELVEFSLDFMNISDIEDIGDFANISNNYHIPDTGEIPDIDSINNTEEISDTQDILINTQDLSPHREILFADPEGFPDLDDLDDIPNVEDIPGIILYPDIENPPNIDDDRDIDIDDDRDIDIDDDRDIDIDDDRDIEADVDIRSGPGIEDGRDIEDCQNIGNGLDLENLPYIDDFSDIDDFIDSEKISNFNELAYVDQFYQKKIESEIKINSIFDLKFLIIPHYTSLKNFFKKKIESSLVFSSAKKGDTHNKMSNDSELISNNSEIKPTNTELTVKNRELTSNDLELTLKNIELTLNKKELVSNHFHFYKKFKDTLKNKYKISLKERESLNYISRWKWKSKALEEKLENLRSFIVLVDVLENDQEIIAFCSNTGIKSDLLNLFLHKNRRNITEKLSYFCAHRLVPISKEPSFMYRTINLLCKLNQKFTTRVKKQLPNHQINNESIPSLSFIATEKIKRIKQKIEEIEEQYGCYNVEDLLLSGRRRELRFLQSVGDINALESESEEEISDLFTEIEQSCENETYGPSDIGKMKRFLWPSYRLEELACIGRFCFNISNGSYFTALKLRIYPTTL
jgi:hypothetical protein